MAGPHLMTKSDLQVGACVRVIVDRWDAPARILARVATDGHAGVMQDWCFTVQWLNRAQSRLRHRNHSLNLFEHDLPHFEVYTSPIELPNSESKRRRAMIPEPTVEQLCLPYGRDDSVPDRPPAGSSISELVRFGTSTWTYEGRQGQVYKRQYAKTSFARECWKSAASPHVYNHWTVVVHMNAGYGRVVSPTGDDLNQL